MHITKIGGTSNVSYNPRALSKRLNIGSDREYSFASVDLSISHLTRPRTVYVQLHEIGHLICRFLRDHVPCSNSFECSSNPDFYCHKRSCLRENKEGYPYYERYEEIFVEMLVHYFVFERNTTLYYRNYIANLSLDPLAYRKSEFDTFRFMFEMLMRGFLASEPFRLHKENLYDGRHKPGSLSDAAFKRFVGVVNDAGPFFYDFKRLWEIGLKGNIKEWFVHTYKEAYEPLCCIWYEVSKICRGIFLITDPPADDIQGLINSIKQSIGEGRPLIRSLYIDPRHRNLSEKSRYLDAFFLIRHLLSEQIKTIYSGIDTENGYTCLLRKPNGYPIDNISKWSVMPNEQILDYSLNTFLAIEPDVRKKSMLNRIAIMKTLWDISTNIRARRMHNILKLCEV